MAGKKRLLIQTGAILGIQLALVMLVEMACRIAEPKIGRSAQQTRFDEDQPEPPPKPPAKSSSELRVFLFGGSSVYGVPVPEVAFAAQLRYWLHRLYPDRDIRVYNFGWGGVDSAYVLNEFRSHLDAQPDLAIVITGNNEFLTRDSNPRLDRIRVVFEKHSSAMRLMERGLAALNESRNVMPSRIQPWDRRSAEFQQRIARFQRTMDEIVALAQRNGIKLIAGTVPSNLADWPPVYQRLAGRDHRYSETISQIQSLLTDRRYTEASGRIVEANRVYSGDAMLYFLQGRIHMALGAYSDAYDSFVQARDLDPVPMRATSQLNSIIRHAASGLPNVYVLDLENLYRERAANGLVGFEQISDNVHGTPLGESIATEAILQTMVQIQLLPRPSKAAGSCCPAGPFLEELAYFSPENPLRLRYLLKTATYIMKTPFFQYGISRDYLLEALRISDHSWEAWANLATISYLTGDATAGANHLKRAHELHDALYHAPLDVNQRSKMPYLKEALRAAAHRN